MNELNTIESLLDFKDEEIKQLHWSWDKGDCSLVGLTEIYLYQCIKKHKKENGVYYDRDYDKIHLRYGQRFANKHSKRYESRNIKNNNYGNTT